MCDTSEHQLCTEISNLLVCLNVSMDKGRYWQVFVLSFSRKTNLAKHLWLVGSAGACGEGTPGSYGFVALWSLSQHLAVWPQCQEKLLSMRLLENFNGGLT